jgi:hypothetical protein
MLEQIQGYEIEVFIVRIIVAIWFGYICLVNMKTNYKRKDRKATLIYLMFLVITISFTNNTFVMSTQNVENIVVDNSIEVVRNFTSSNDIDYICTKQFDIETCIPIE